MNQSEYYPFPKNFLVEVQACLANFVNQWISIRVLVIDILFKQIGEKTAPTGKNSVVHHR